MTRRGGQANDPAAPYSALLLDLERERAILARDRRRVLLGYVLMYAGVISGKSTQVVFVPAICLMFMAMVGSYSSSSMSADAFSLKTRCARLREEVAKIRARA